MGNAENVSLKIGEIADAIRGKTGESSPIGIADMPGLVRGLVVSSVKSNYGDVGLDKPNTTDVTITFDNPLVVSNSVVTIYIYGLDANDGYPNQFAFIKIIDGKQDSAAWETKGCSIRLNSITETAMNLTCVFSSTNKTLLNGISYAGFNRG